MQLDVAKAQVKQANAQAEEANAWAGSLAEQIAREQARAESAPPPTAAPQPKPKPPTVDDRCAALVDAHGLTAREAEILLLTARGHASSYIAEQLFISASTVRFHQQNIYRKLDVHSRQELLILVNGEEAQ